MESANMRRPPERLEIKGCKKEHSNWLSDTNMMTQVTILHITHNTGEPQASDEDVTRHKRRTRGTAHLPARRDRTHPPGCGV